MSGKLVNMPVFKITYSWKSTTIRSDRYIPALDLDEAVTLFRKVYRRKDVTIDLVSLVLGQKVDIYERD